MKILNSIYKYSKKIKKIIKSSLWAIELLIAIIGIFLAYFALFIAYPEYKDFMVKNNIPNLNGQWEIEFVTLDSSYNEYIGDKNTYNLFFIGDKNEYISKGERVKTNDKYIENFDNRDRLEFKFFVKDNTIYSLFDLYGQRKTDGNFEAILSKDANSFEGKFIGNAAESKGIIKGIKIN